MISQSDHRESWTVTITRELGDDWPDMEVGRRSLRMHPDRIEFTLHRGEDRPWVFVAGRNYLKNGELGHLTLSESSPGHIPWVLALVREAREQLDLGSGITEVPW
jgi:hypothetical protein